MDVSFYVPLHETEMSWVVWRERLACVVLTSGVLVVTALHSVVSQRLRVTLKFKVGVPNKDGLKIRDTKCNRALEHHRHYIQRRGFSHCWFLIIVYFSNYENLELREKIGFCPQVIRAFF